MDNGEDADLFPEITQEFLFQPPHKVIIVR